MSCRSTIVVCTFTAVIGCAPAAQQLSGAAVEGAVESAGERDTRQQLEDLTQSPEFGEAMAQVGEGLARGVLTGVEQGPVELEPTVERVGASLVRGIGSELGLAELELPSARGVAGDVVDGALRSAASDANRERARLLVGDLTHTMMRTATASFAEGVEQDIMPALDEARTRVPTLATLVGDDAAQLAGSMAYEISRQSALGVDQAMNQIAAENERRQEGVLGRMSVVGWAVLASALLLLLGAIAIIIVLAVRNRRTRDQLREDSHEREQLLVTLVAGLAGREGFDERLHTALLRFLGNKDEGGREPPPPPPGPGRGTAEPSSSGPLLGEPLTRHVRHG